jgi:hypothetical protein
LGIFRVACSTAVTHGSPYSLHSEVPWESTPPVSSTNPLMRPNTVVHDGSVWRVTSISPSLTVDSSRTS